MQKTSKHAHRQMARSQTGRMASAHIEHVGHGGAVLNKKVWDMKSPGRIPANGQLLLGPSKQVIQRLVIDFTVGRPARKLHCSSSRVHWDCLDMCLGLTSCLAR